MAGAKKKKHNLKAKKRDEKEGGATRFRSFNDRLRDGDTRSTRELDFVSSSSRVAATSSAASAAHWGPATQTFSVNDDDEEDVVVGDQHHDGPWPADALPAVPVDDEDIIERILEAETHFAEALQRYAFSCRVQKWSRVVNRVRDLLLEDRKHSRSGSLPQLLLYKESLVGIILAVEGQGDDFFQGKRPITGPKGGAQEAHEEHTAGAGAADDAAGGEGEEVGPKSKRQKPAQELQKKSSTDAKNHNRLPAAAKINANDSGTNHEHIEPCCRLLAALAQDLRQEFVPCMLPVATKLMKWAVNILSQSGQFTNFGASETAATAVKEIFKGLSSFFKFLAKYMDVEAFLTGFLGAEATRTAVEEKTFRYENEAIDVLLRVVLKNAAATSTIATASTSQKSLLDLISISLFESVRSLGGQFRLQTAKILRDVIPTAEKGATNQYFVAKIFVHRLFDYVDADFFSSDSSQSELAAELLNLLEEEVELEVAVSSWDDTRTSNTTRDKVLFWHLDVIQTCYRSFFAKGKWRQSVPAEARAFLKKFGEIMRRSERLGSVLSTKTCALQKTSEGTEEGDAKRISDLSLLQEHYPPGSSSSASRCCDNSLRQAGLRFGARMVVYGFGNELKPFLKKLIEVGDAVVEFLACLRDEIGELEPREFRTSLKHPLLQEFPHLTGNVWLVAECLRVFATMKSLTLFDDGADGNRKHAFESLLFLLQTASLCDSDDLADAFFRGLRQKSDEEREQKEVALRLRDFMQTTVLHVGLGLNVVREDVDTAENGEADLRLVATECVLWYLRGLQPIFDGEKVLPFRFSADVKQKIENEWAEKSLEGADAAEPAAAGLCSNVVWHSRTAQVVELIGHCCDNEESFLNSVVMRAFAVDTFRSACAATDASFLESVWTTTRRLRASPSSASSGLAVVSAWTEERAGRGTGHCLSELFKSNDARVRWMTLCIVKQLPAAYLEREVDLKVWGCDERPDLAALDAFHVRGVSRASITTGEREEEELLTHNAENKHGLIEELLEACYQMENAELSLEQERFRTSKITEIAKIVPKLGNTLAALIGVQVLFSQLRVRYSPLWKPTLDCLRALVLMESGGEEDGPTGGAQRNGCTSSWLRDTIYLVVKEAIVGTQTLFLKSGGENAMSDEPAAEDDGENDPAENVEKDFDQKKQEEKKTSAPTVSQTRNFHLKKTRQKDVRYLDLERLFDSSCTLQRPARFSLAAGTADHPSSSEQAEIGRNSLSPFWAAPGCGTTTASAAASSQEHAAPSKTVVHYHDLVWQAATKVGVTQDFALWVLTKNVQYLNQFWRAGTRTKMLCKHALTSLAEISSGGAGNGPSANRSGDDDPSTTKAASAGTQTQTLEAFFGLKEHHGASSKAGDLPSIPERKQHLADLLFAVEHFLLQSEDTQTQQLALRVLTASERYRGFLLPYSENLVRLTEDKKFRNEITGITLDDSTISEVEKERGTHAGVNRKLFPHPKHRKLILPVLVKLLYAKLVKKSRALDKHSSCEGRRRAVFQLLSQGLRKNELAELVLVFCGGLLEVAHDDAVGGAGTATAETGTGSCRSVGSKKAQAENENQIRAQREQLGDLRRFLVVAEFGANRTWCAETRRTLWKVLPTADARTSTKETASCSAGKEIVQIGLNLACRGRWQPFLLTLSDVITQMKTVIAPFAPFFMELSVSILSQTALANEKSLLAVEPERHERVAVQQLQTRSGQPQQKEEKERALIRLALVRVHDVIATCAEPDSVDFYAQSLTQVAPLLNHLAVELPSGGGAVEVSAIGKLLTMIAAHPHLWSIYEAFPTFLPGLFEILNSNPVRARIASGKDAGGPVVARVVEVALRLCLGGQTLDAGSTSAGGSAVTYGAHEHKRRYGKRDIDFDERKVQGKLNQFDDVQNDVADAEGDVLMMGEAAGDESDSEERTLKARTAQGLNLVRPHVDKICDGLLGLLMQRKNFNCSATTATHSKHKKFQTSTFVTQPELQLLFQVSDLISNAETAEKLMGLLLISLFDSRDAKMVTALLEAMMKLTKTCVVSATFPRQLISKLEPLLGAMKDLTSRQKLAQLLLQLNEAGAGLLQNSKNHNASETSTTAQQVVAASLSLESILLEGRRRTTVANDSDKADEIQLETYAKVKSWIFENAAKNDEHVVNARAIAALNWTRRQATVEPDYDLHVEVFTALREREYMVKASARLLKPLFHHCTFILSQPVCDHAVRGEVEALYAQFAKDRIAARISSVSAEEIFHTRTTGGEQESSADHKSDSVLEVLFKQALPPLRKNLKSASSTVVDSSIRIFRAFFLQMKDSCLPVVLQRYAAVFGGGVLTTSSAASEQMHLLGLHIDFLRAMENGQIDDSILVNEDQKHDGREFARFLDMRRGSLGAAAAGWTGPQAPPGNDVCSVSALICLRPRPQSGGVDEEGEAAPAASPILIDSPAANFLHLDMVSFFQKHIDLDDIFESLIHLQKHRRARAMQTLVTAIEKQNSSLRPSTLVNLCVPLATTAVLQRNATKDTYDANLGEVGIKLLAASLGRASQWNKILEAVKGFAKVLREFKDKVHERFVIRAIVACLQAYRFVAADEGTGEAVRAGGQMQKVYAGSHARGAEGSTKLTGEKATEYVLKRVENAEAEKQDACESVADVPVDVDEENQLQQTQADEDAATAESARIVAQSLKVSVLPILKKLLWDKSKADGEDGDAKASSAGGKKAPPGQVRLPVVGCLMHILPYLQERDFYEELPRLLRQLCDGLRARQLDLRDAARKALQQCALALGPAWFLFILQTLQTALNKGGYQAAVCIFSTHSALHALVEAFYNKAASSSAEDAEAEQDDGEPGEPRQAEASKMASALHGALDTCLPELRGLVFQELERMAEPDAGDEGTDNNAHRKNLCLEAKKIRGPDILKLVAQICSPGEILKEIVEEGYGLLLQDRGLGPQEMQAARAHSVKYLNRVKELLFATIHGLMKNPSFQLQQQLDVVSDGLKRSVELLRLVGGSGDNSNVGGGSGKADDHSSGATRAKPDAVPQASEDQKEAWLNLKKEETFTVQPGAARGNQEWRVAVTRKGFDATARAEIFGAVGLRLFTHVLKTQQEQLTATASSGSHASVVKQQILPHLITCFVGKQDLLMHGAAKCLLKLQKSIPDEFERHGKRIAAQILKTFQHAAVQQDLSLRLRKKRQHHIDIVPCVTQLLSGLLAKNRSAAWFLEALENERGLDDEEHAAAKRRKLGSFAAIADLSSTATCAVGGGSALAGGAGGGAAASSAEKAAAPRSATSKRKAARRELESSFFFEALLAQIATSLDQAKLRPSALQLLRRVLARSSAGLRKLPYVYRVLDRVGEIVCNGVVSDGSNADVTAALAGQLYCDFLLDFEHEKMGLQKRIQRLIAAVAKTTASNGSSSSDHVDSSSIYSLQHRVAGCRSALNCLNSLQNAFPEALLNEYRTLFFLTAVARLASEKDKRLREMLKLFLSNLVHKSTNDGKRGLLDLMLEYGKTPKILPAMAESVSCFIQGTQNKATSAQPAGTSTTPNDSSSTSSTKLTVLDELALRNLAFFLREAEENHFDLQRDRMVYSAALSFQQMTNEGGIARKLLAAAASVQRHEERQKQVGSKTSCKKKGEADLGAVFAGARDHYASVMGALLSATATCGVSVSASTAVEPGADGANKEKAFDVSRSDVAPWITACVLRIIGGSESFLKEHYGVLSATRGRNPNLAAGRRTKSTASRDEEGGAGVSLLQLKDNTSKLLLDDGLESHYTLSPLVVRALLRTLFCMREVPELWEDEYQKLLNAGSAEGVDVDAAADEEQPPAAAEDVEADDLKIATQELENDGTERGGVTDVDLDLDRTADENAEHDEPEADEEEEDDADAALLAPEQIADDLVDGNRCLLLQAASPGNHETLSGIGSNIDAAAQLHRPSDEKPAATSETFRTLMQKTCSYLSYKGRCFLKNANGHKVRLATLVRLFGHFAALAPTDVVADRKILHAVLSFLLRISSIGNQAIVAEGGLTGPPPASMEAFVRLDDPLPAMAAWATEAVDVLKKRVSSAEPEISGAVYSGDMFEEERQKVLKLVQQRRTSRRIAAVASKVTNPEKAALRRVKKNKTKVVKRKQKKNASIKLRKKN
eukprot:g7200.t1